MTAAAQPLPTAAANAAVWLEAPPPNPKPKRFDVTVTTEAGYRHDYRAAFKTSWDAYDDAMNRFPFAARVQVRPHANPQPGTAS